MHLAETEFAKTEAAETQAKQRKPDELRMCELCFVEWTVSFIGKLNGLSKMQHPLKQTLLIFILLEQI